MGVTGATVAPHPATHPARSLLLGLLLLEVLGACPLGTRELAPQGGGALLEPGAAATVVRRHLLEVALDLAQLGGDDRDAAVPLLHVWPRCSVRGWVGRPGGRRAPTTCECAMPTILTINDRAPDVERARFIADDVVLAGNVTLGQDATLWYGVVARAEYSRVTIGARTNVQDGSILHADPDHPCVVGSDVTIGHRSVIHGCTLGDGVLIGMGAVVLNGAVVGAGSLVAAGAVVREGDQIPPNSLVVGVPAAVRKDLGEGRARYPNVAGYLHLGELYAAAEASEG